MYTKWGWNCSKDGRTRIVVSETEPMACPDHPDEAGMRGEDMLTSDGVAVLDDSTGKEYRIRVVDGIVKAVAP